MARHRSFALEEGWVESANRKRSHINGSGKHHKSISDKSRVLFESGAKHRSLKGSEGSKPGSNTLSV